MQSQKCRGSRYILGWDEGKDGLTDKQNNIQWHLYGELQTNDGPAFSQQLQYLILIDGTKGMCRVEMLKDGNSFITCISSVHELGGKTIMDHELWKGFLVDLRWLYYSLSCQ